MNFAPLFYLNGFPVARVLVSYKLTNPVAAKHSRERPAYWAAQKREQENLFKTYVENRGMEHPIELDISPRSHLDTANMLDVKCNKPS